MPRKLFLFPFGGNAREALLSVFALNEREPVWEVLGFIDDDTSRHGRECCGVPVAGGRELLGLEPEAWLLAVPGSPTSYGARGDLISGLPVETSRFATIVHPSVVVSPDARIGINTVMMPHGVVSSGVTVGNHCVILPNTVLSHDSSVGDFCCIGSNVSVSGSVNIGPGCYIGSGTKIREDITIGAGSMVGLGSTVIHDVPAGVIVAGSPARVLKKIGVEPPRHVCA